MDEVVMTPEGPLSDPRLQGSVWEHAPRRKSSDFPGSIPGGSERLCVRGPPARRGSLVLHNYIGDEQVSPLLSPRPRASGSECANFAWALSV